MISFAIIGKNFGDEGKGLACASLCNCGEKCLIIKHNGGGQAGHTVERIDGKRFIHHQIGSGAEYGGDTLFAETFHPDLYQLKNEINDFKDMFGCIPVIYSMGDAKITTIDDVLLNMGAEIARGDSRHGSCGMGINECEERVKAGFCLTVSDIASHDIIWIINKLEYIREHYTINRRKALNIDSGEYFDMLCDTDILTGYAKEIKENIEFIKIVDAKTSWLNNYDRIIFETGQGLLLDNDYIKYEPYLTPSKTGLFNPVNFLNSRGLKLTEAIYVTRSYVTRHGNGPIPFECSPDEFKNFERDLTNMPNEWQGTIRYGRHESISDFFKDIKNDMDAALKSEDTKISLLITHMNETDGKLCFADKDISPDEIFSKLPPYINNLYLSYDHFSLKKF